MKKICNDGDVTAIVLGTTIHIYEAQMLKELKDNGICSPIYVYEDIKCLDWFKDNDFSIKMEKNKEIIQYVMEHLEDDESRKVLLDIMKYKITHDWKYLQEEVSKDEYFPNRSEFALHDHEVFIDAGAAEGDTAESFFEHARNINYKKIYSFEPNSVNQKILNVKKTYCRNDRWEIYPYGLSDRNESIRFAAVPDKLYAGKVIDGQLDDVLYENYEEEIIQVKSLDDLLYDKEAKITYIKMDIEGSELKALQGAKKIISRDKPRMAISIYHESEQLYMIPYYIMKNYPEYKCFIRKHTKLPVDIDLYVYTENNNQK